MKHYEYEINLLFDGELDRDEQRELFNHLSSCDLCLENFSTYYQLKTETKSFYEQNMTNIFVQSDQIVEQLTKKAEVSNSVILNKTYKIGFYTSAVAAAILLFVLFTNKPAPTYISQNGVRVDTVSVQNQSKSNNSLTPGKKELIQKRKRQPYLEYLLSLRTEKVTQADLVRIN